MVKLCVTGGRARRAEATNVQHHGLKTPFLSFSGSLKWLSPSLSLKPFPLVFPVESPGVNTILKKL